MQEQARLTEQDPGRQLVCLYDTGDGRKCGLPSFVKDVADHPENPAPCRKHYFEYRGKHYEQ